MMNQQMKSISLRLLILVIQSKKAHYDTTIDETEKKSPDHDHSKYTTTGEFNKLTTVNFAARLALAKLN